MGRFSTTVQIKNNADRMRFLNSFCDVMEKRGFVPCSEDEAALSYLLAFGEGGWVTLTSEEYKNNPQKAYTHNVAIAQIPVAWAVAKGTLPIIGVTKTSHVEDAAKAAELILSASEMEDIESCAKRADIDVIRMWEKEMK